MSGFYGNYAPELFDERKRYYLLQAQEKISLTDAELRDLHEMASTFTRRVIQGQVGDSAIGDGFRVIQHPVNATNDFQIVGGDGSLNNLGTLFLKGFRLSLRNNISYSDQNNSGSITDDAYTETSLPALTTPTGTTTTLNAFDENNGVIIGVGNNGTIVKSIDSGRNFVPKTSGVTCNLYGVAFADANNVYAVGYGNGTILWSTDSGETWNFTTTAFNWNDVSFVNPSLGRVVGPSGKMFIGTGLSWSSDPTGDLDTTNNLNSISTFDNAHIWAVGDAGTILRYDGLGWSSQLSNTTNNLTNVFASTSSIVLACGNNGTIQKTVNDGTNWLPKNSGVTTNLNSIFIEGSNGWAVGDNGLLLTSINTGETWDSTVIDPSYNFESVIFSDTTGFIAGTNGIIYRTLDGATWEKYRTDYVYIDSYLAEVSGINSSDYYDPMLIDAVVGAPSANRLRLVQDVKVTEGWPVPPDYSYTDIEEIVHQHYIYPLAKIQRYVGDSTINQSYITDLRTVNLTISEINGLLKNGGIDSTALAAESVTPDKINPNDEYVFGAVHTNGDASIGGNLWVEGSLYVDSSIKTSYFVENLTVYGSSQLGTLGQDNTIGINGQIAQVNDTSSSYVIHSLPTTSYSPAISILQDGSGHVLKIVKTNLSNLSVIDSTSSGNGYDIHLVHLGGNGGLLKALDDSTSDSIQITKDATRALGSVINITSNSYGPSLKINNNALGPSTSILIDQSSGTAINIQSVNDASSIAIHSTGTGSDLKIQHDNMNGYVLDMTSSGLVAISLNNLKGQAAVITQNDNQNLLTLTKESLGSGRVIEVNNYGIDPAIQINSDGSGIGLHVSHTGDSTVPAVDIFTAGNETGPSLRILKANQGCGQALDIKNKGLSQSLHIYQDNTDSTASVLDIRNFSYGLDIKSMNWCVDSTGNFITNGNISLSNIYLYSDGTDIYAKRNSDNKTSKLSTTWS
jgi:photosystem II stability/assembly factor-like uncharacterized protein